MALIRTGFDRRSNINRRQMELSVKTEQRRTERRQRGEPRAKWIRTSKWSSKDQDQANRYFWHLLKLSRPEKNPSGTDKIS